MTSKEKVLLGLSGGVDSAVAALLLKKQGYEVIGAFMKNFSETKNSLTGECHYLEDKKDAQKIAAILGIKFITLNFEKEYKKYVIDPMFKAYKSGLTPNPDSLCNKIIKFPLLWKHAKKLGCSYIATGHYVRVKKTSSGTSLLRGKDEKKDQSYFLYDLTQQDLKHTLFPIGNFTKEKVRKIARKNKFPNADKKGTRGICFVGKISMKPFLEQKIKPKKGKVLSPEKEVIGSHKGIMFYTIGERIAPSSGILIDNKIKNTSGKKWYVADKIINKNIIIAAPQNHPSLKKDSFYLKKINWIEKKQKPPIKAKVRIRHLGELIPAQITSKNNKIFCKLKKPTQGLAEGQSAVIYKGSKVLCGGEIRYR